MIVKDIITFLYKCWIISVIISSKVLIEAEKIGYKHGQGVMEQKLRSKEFI